jgi:hypothetical protein
MRCCGRGLLLFVHGDGCFVAKVGNIYYTMCLPHLNLKSGIRIILHIDEGTSSQIVHIQHTLSHLVNKHITKPPSIHFHNHTCNLSSTTTWETVSATANPPMAP